MKKTFLNGSKKLLTVMVQAQKPDRIKELMDKSAPEGAEAFGMQFERLLPEYRNTDTYKELFSYTDKPVYVTNYRRFSNEDKSDLQLADELLELADYGATLCDVMGDYFDRQPGEMTMDADAVKKQIELIDGLHQKGAEVLMSSHVLKFTPSEKVLEIAMEHQKRGADISKIVTWADTAEEELENLKIINMLRENLKVPFLFLSGGSNCRLVRRIGGEIGCSMYLCVHEHDEFATKEQPLLTKLKSIRDNF